jgi:hypothetical protein
MITNITEKFQTVFPIINQIGVEFFANKLHKDTFIISARNNDVTINSVLTLENVKKIFNIFDKKMSEDLLNLLELSNVFMFNLNSIQTNNVRCYLSKEEIETNPIILERYPFNCNIQDDDQKLTGIGFTFDDQKLIEYKYYYSSIIKNTVYNYKFDTDKSYKHYIVEYLDSKKSTLLNTIEHLDLRNLTITVSHRDDGQEYLILKNIIFNNTSTPIDPVELHKDVT